MTPDDAQIRQMAQEGKCCSQIIIAMALKYKGQDNPVMIEAARGLCKGLHTWRICGVLSAAAMAFALFDQENAAKHMIPQLFEWFGDNVKNEFGGESCQEITGGKPKPEVCIELVIKTWLEIKSILGEFGFDPVS